MRLSDPTSREKEKQQYHWSDVKRLADKRPWRSYDDMINWLQQEGDEDRRFTPGEVAKMIEDLSRVKQRGVEFTTDPERLYQEMTR